MYEQAIDDELDQRGGIWQLYSRHVVGGVIVVVIGVVTVVYRTLEDWSWADSLYFCVITLTTVGYGDLAPTTGASRLFTVVYVCVGISLLGAALNELLKRRSRSFAKKRAQRAS